MTQRVEMPVVIVDTREQHPDTLLGWARLRYRLPVCFATNHNAAAARGEQP